MNQHFQPSKQASIAEISDALAVLFDVLPFQRGTRSDNAALAYVDALSGFPADAVLAGIRKFMRGECQNVSPKFVPTPPELAGIVRTTVVPSRVPEDRRIAPPKPMEAGERDRMRLKVPMFQYALANGRIDDLARANEQGFTAMAALAATWGIPIPDAFIGQDDDRLEREWHSARNRAWREIEMNPPPFMRQARKGHRHVS